MNRSKSTFFTYLILIFIISGAMSCRSGERSAGPLDLVVSEGFENPLGFYDDQPTFSWKLPSDVNAQQAYSIAVSTSPELLPGKADLWKSGKIVSAQSIHLPYEGKKLSSRQKVYWQVKIWDVNGTESAWSEKAHFELGLLKNEDWTSKWISLPDQKAIMIEKINRKVHPVQYLRKDFELRNDLTEARLYITAKGLFQAYINGEKVGNDDFTPGWTPYQKRIESLTYEVTELLQAGQNALGIELAEGWHSGRLLGRGYPSVYPEVIAQLEVRYADGKQETYQTDASWKGTTNGPIRYSSIYDGESYDANMEFPGWNQEGFDEAAWTGVVTSPVSSEVRLSPKRHYKVSTQVELPTQSISEPTEGKLVFDLGQNMAGVPDLNIPVVKGQLVTIRFAEMLQPNGEIYTDNYRNAVSTDYYLPAEDGTIQWRPTFTFHGFRYVEVSGFDERVSPEKSWVRGLALHSDFTLAGNFSSSHEKLNQLQSNIQWGLRGNFLDIPTDCPQRNERLGWTGDAQVFIPTSLFIADVHSFWASWMQSVREEQEENGAIPCVIPDTWRPQYSSGWGDAVTIVPWEVYWRTGDKRILKDSYSAMNRWLEYYQTNGENHIIDMFTYGDWLQPNSQREDERRGETDEKLISTAYFARSIDLTKKTAEVLGLVDEVERLAKLHQSVKEAFQNYFFDENGRISIGTPTQTGYLLAIGFDLLNQEMEEKAIPHLVEEIEKVDSHLKTGFLGTPLLAPVMERIGRTDLMLTMLFKETYPSWFYSINQGSTTMWERWDSYTHENGFHKGGMNSFNHYAYGAIGQFMYERLAGIKPLEPGYKKIEIAPITGGPLTSAKASYQSPFGEIKSAWMLTDNQLEVKATIPANTEAIVKLPADFSEKLWINGEEYGESHSVKIIDKKHGIYTMSIIPGSYTFRTTLTED